MNVESQKLYPFDETGNAGKILVVDDDSTIRKILHRTLGKAGYLVTEAVSGQEALSLLEKERFSLVLLDIIMPEANGIDVLVQIRKNFSLAELPVVMITVKDSRDNITRALSAGANEYVIKPIDFPILCARIENILSHKRLGDELRKAHNELEMRVVERTNTLLESNKALEKEIQARRQMERKLLENTEYYQALLAYGQDIIAVFESDGTVFYESPSLERVLGYKPEERIGLNTFDLIHPDDREAVANRFREAFASPGIVFTETARFKHKDGDWRLLESTGTVTEIRGRLRGIVNARDVTERNKLTERLSYQASHDLLTGLINRFEFLCRLDQISEIHEAEDLQSTLLYIDIDQFKIINEISGNMAGDEMIKQFSGILLSYAREPDIVARLGGDEFGILLQNTNIIHAKNTALKLLDDIEKMRITWEDRVYTISASIGMVPVNKTIVPSSNLMERAEAACYVAKDAGRNQIHVYHEEDEIISQRQGEMIWVGNINQALNENQFCLYLQPILPLHEQETDNYVHYELLIRMRDNNKNLVPPNKFLSVAERYNLATRLDRWVIKTAFDWLKDNPGHLEELNQCSINLSGLSLGNESVLRYIIDLLKRYDIPPYKICFEITETAAIANMLNATRFIKILRETGCRFALDDFGSGVSSFGYLKKLSIDYLKIDGMFVREIDKDNISLAMVKSINEIGKAMGKQTIAEFVESENILQILRQLGVDYAQGYHIGKPVEIETYITGC